MHYFHVWCRVAVVLSTDTHKRTLPSLCLDQFPIGQQTRRLDLPVTQFSVYEPQITDYPCLLFLPRNTGYKTRALVWIQGHVSHARARVLGKVIENTQCWGAGSKDETSSMEVVDKTFYELKQWDVSCLRSRMVGNDDVMFWSLWFKRKQWKD